MAVLTPYLLTETLGLDEARQGRALSQLTIVNEIVLIFAYGPLGALSDRFGRRIIYAGGFLAMATAYVLFPMVTSLNGFSFVRALYAIGTGAATGIATIIVEQQVDEALRYAQRALILDHGTVVHAAPAAELLADEATLERWVGMAVH